jgi:hypothetical protein
MSERIRVRRGCLFGSTPVKDGHISWPVETALAIGKFDVAGQFPARLLMIGQATQSVNF